VRIERLDLTAYGPFSGRTLDLSNLGVHVIVGVNEAGKSRALGAIIDGLFGIPERTTSNFVHVNDALEIGMALRSSDGRSLEFRRRKRRKDPLVDAGGSVVTEADLAAFVPSVSREAFEQMFGIDHTRLEDGGHAILEGRGEVGALLFGASAGITDLRGALSKLEAEAATLFSGRKGVTKPGLNAAITKYSAAAAAMNAASVGPEAHYRLVREIIKLEAKEQDLREQAEDAGRSHAEATLLLALLSKLRRRRELVAALSEFTPGAVRLREDLPDDLALAIDGRDGAKDDVGEIERRMAGLDVRMADIQVDEPILGQGNRISELTGGREHYRSAKGECPGVASEEATHRRRAVELLTQLRPGVEAEQAMQLTLMPTLAVANAEGLAEAANAMTKDVESAQAAVRESQSELNEVLAALAEAGEETDSAALKSSVAVCKKDGDIVAQRRQVANDARDLEMEVAKATSSLDLVGSSAEEILALAVPGNETVEDFARRFDTLGESVRSLENDLKAQRTLREQRAMELAALRASADVPSEDELTEARSDRQGLWSRIRRLVVTDQGESVRIADRLDDATPDEDEGMEHPGEVADPSELAGSYEGAVATADQLADRLRREADAVARRAQLEAEIAHSDEEIARFSQDLELRQGERTDLQQEWKRLWEAAGIDPREPAQMALWKARFGALVAQCASLATMTARLAALDDAIETNRGHLLEALAGIGVMVASEAPLAVALERAEQALETFATEEEQRRQLEKDRTRLLALVERREVALTDAQARKQEWEESWSDALSALTLPAGTSPQSVKQFLARSGEARQSLELAESAASRVREMDEYMASFDQELADIVSLVAPDLVDVETLGALSALSDRLAVQTKAMTKRSTHQTEWDGFSVELSEARLLLTAAEETIGDLVLEAQATDEAELRTNVDRFEVVRRAEGELTALDSDLRTSSQGRGPAELNEALGAADETALDAQISRFHEVQHDLEGQRDTTHSTLIEKRHEFELMDGSAAAAVAFAEAQTELAEIGRLTERYMAAELASRLLRRQMEVFMAEQQAPLMDRARPWFSQLTCGSFTTLETDFGLKDETVLMGVRPNGDRVGIEGFTGGTTDQLYLAFRLAAISLAAERSEPMPLVFDDIFEKFDEPRTAAALGILSELSQRSQVLVFTHHRHVAEVAKEAIDGGLLTLHELEPRDPGR
jgi:uncharacterized protein YhaN